MIVGLGESHVVGIFHFKRRGDCVLIGGRVGSAPMKVFSLLVLVVALMGVSCERHDFEETRKLHDKHGAGHGDEHAGDAH